MVLNLLILGERFIPHLKTDFKKKKIRREPDEQSIPLPRCTMSTINTVLENTAVCVYSNDPMVRYQLSRDETTVASTMVGQNVLLLSPVVARLDGKTLYGSTSENPTAGRRRRCHHVHATRDRSQWNSYATLLSGRETAQQGYRLRLGRHFSFPT